MPGGRCLVRNSTMAATGRLSKGIVRTPPDSFLNARASPLVFIRKRAGEPVEKSSALDWAFDTMPI